MRILAAALAITAAIATPLVAQQMKVPGSKNVAVVTGGTYQADANHTFVIWTVDHLGFSPLSGTFGEITGSLQLDPRNLKATRVDITIPVTKMALPSAGLRGHLLRPGKDGGKPDFFGATPADGKFVSTSVVAAGKDKAKLSGDLTLNGVTKAVTLDVEFYGAGKMPAQMGGKENVGFTATGAIQRSDFGLGLAVPIVSDKVELKIAAAFVK
ncbi:YceI family protein [Sphingomonas sp. MG17]|uniref:YceI family protein n=1 Tax=Sphingomonas tagetis TaxID=2949092 RepID=A0A9X2HNP9_9SPHN|nr:YceI family protein [Sphingomonas tagetis]MCP3729180.1 YceI family protein [Sphingomonas tagetis]